MSKIIDHEIERFLLSGIIQYKHQYDEISPIIKEEDFDLSIHKAIYKFLVASAAAGEEYDHKLIAFKIEQAKLRYEMELSVGEYLETVSLINIKEESIVEYAKRLKSLSVRRQIEATALNVAAKMRDCGDEKYSAIINLADSTFYSGVQVFENSTNDPIDIFAELEAQIEDLGNRQEPDGVICPYPILRSQYGNFLPGHIYVFAARLKAGKSTLVQNISYKCCCENDLQDVKCLYLDTELTTDQFQTRLVASLSGVSEAYIRTGRWRKDEMMLTKVREALARTRKFHNRIQHIYIGGADMETVIPLIRRWNRKHVANHQSVTGRPFFGMVSLDYLKLSDELDKKSVLRTDQILGRKVDRFKQICTDLGVCPITAIQTSRANVGANKVSDSSVISNSDMVAQLASNVCLLERLELEEVQMLGVDFGVTATHSLISVASRNQGYDAPGFNDNVKIQKGDGFEYVSNKLYYNFDNFSVREVNSLDKLVNTTDHHIATNSGNRSDVDI